MKEHPILIGFCILLICAGAANHGWGGFVLGCVIAFFLYIGVTES